MAAGGSIYFLWTKMAVPPVNALLIFQTCVPGILLSLITLSATWLPYCIPNVPCSKLNWNR